MPGLEILEKVKAEGRLILMEHEAKRFCELHGIPVARTEFASTEDEAVKAAEKMGYPVVVKVASPDITHKSDVGGVILNLESSRQVREAYKEIYEKVGKTYPSARILGVTVGEMVKSSVEVAVGIVRDAQFGPALMFGLGGVFIEVLKDATFRICPVSRADALEMIGEIKAYPILKGYRGIPPADLEMLASILIKVSEMAVEHLEIVEADLNPVMVYGSEVKVADARIILSG
jgi:acetyl-CoA synthetase (ADP-forming)